FKVLRGDRAMALLKWRSAALALPVLVLCAGQLLAEDKKPARESAIAFSTLETMNADLARGKALDWLKQIGKSDADSLKAFDAIWDSDKSVLDKVTATFTLGDAAAARIIAEARDPATPAPTAVPDVLKDDKQPQFFRANLSLAYGKVLV